MGNGAILVTGGRGFVGSHFARAAFDAGREIVILDNGSGGPPAKLPPGIVIIEGDIADREVLCRIMREHNVGAVAHFAGKIQVGESVRDPSLYFDQNVIRSLALLNAMRDQGVTNILFSSSAAVYGNARTVPIPESSAKEPISPYGATKLVFEFALDAWQHAYGFRWSALRYFNAAGAQPDGTIRENHRPETHLIPLAIDAALGTGPALSVFGNDYDTPDGTCVRDYIHVCDLANAHLLALEKLEAGTSLGAMNLGTGNGSSVQEILAVTEKIVGRPLPHSIAPRRAGDPPQLVADPTNAMSTLGWKPQRSSLELMIEDALRSRTS